VTVAFIVEEGVGEVEVGEEVNALIVLGTDQDLIGGGRRREEKRRRRGGGGQDMAEW